VDVREVRPEEYAEAGRVTAGAYREFAPQGNADWEKYLREIADIGGRAAKTPVLVAVEEGRILGSATVEMDDRVVGDDDAALPPEMASLRMLGVDPQARGRGAGRALVEATIDLARRSGKTLCVLRTTERMVVAHRLYESMGFERDLARDLVFEDGFRLVAYRLAI
jgi:GNAT superfamily N-acetyltransferase